MIKTKRIALTLAALLVAGCQTPQEQAPMEIASTALTNANGTPTGAARLFRQAGQLVINVAVSGQQPGELHARLIEAGSCARNAGQLPPQISTALPVMRIDAQGKGTMSALIPGAFPDGLEKAVAIYGADNALVACGLLSAL